MENLSKILKGYLFKYFLEVKETKDKDFLDLALNMTFDINIFLEYKSINLLIKSFLISKLFVKTNLKRFSLNGECVPLTYARFSKFCIFE